LKGKAPIGVFFECSNQKEEIKMEEKRTYETAELPLAAAIMAAGIEFLGTDGDDGWHLTFKFIWDTRISDMERLFFEGKLQAEILAFVNAFRKLKAGIRRKRSMEERRKDDNDR